MSFREVTSFERSTTPYSAIGLVNVTWADGTRSSGSAAVVGRNDILTAAHVVYNPDRGGWATGFDFYFGADYNDALGYFESYGYRLTSDFRWQVKAGINGAFVDGNNSRMTDSEAQHDIALIGVSVEIGKQTGWLGYDTGRNFTQTVNAAGYPDGATGLMTERVTVTSSNRWGIYEGNGQMRQGSSGGPLFTDDNYVLGVKVGSSDTWSIWSDLGFSWHWIKPFMDENDALLGGTGIVPRLPTYSLSAQSTSVNEGESARFTLTTTNVTAFTTLTYRITGVQAEDIEDGRLTGTVVVGQDGKATIAIPIKKDLITEGDETLRIAVDTATASVLVKDTSKTVNYSSGDRYVGDVIDGRWHGQGTYTFADGSRYVGEFRDGKYHGQGTYTFANGNKYVGEFRDDNYHGQGTLTFTDGVVWSGEWRESELMSPVYSLRPQSSSIDEGRTAQFDLVVTNYKSNTTFLYTTSGVQASDILGGHLTGPVTIDTQGRAKVFIPIVADNVTEGPETLTLTLRTLFPTGPGGDFESVTSSVSVADTSRTPKGPADEMPVYVFKSDRIGPGINEASYSYFYTVNVDERVNLIAQTSWPWSEKKVTFEAAHSNPSQSVPLYRFWSDKMQAHFFTNSQAEKFQIITWSQSGTNGYDWVYEGEAFRVYQDASPTDASDKNAIPVYRLWMDDKDFNPSNGLVGGHYFTADRAEYDSMLKLTGVLGEGVAFYGEVPGV